MKRFKSLLSLLLVLVMMLSLAVPALAAANEISVTVVDTNGAPVSGATVSLRENVHTGAGHYANGPQEIATGVTDANGQYTFTGIVTSGEHEHSKWSVACNGVVSGDIDATGVNSGRDVTVTVAAAPAPQTYTITFDGNGGATNDSKTTYTQENVSGTVALASNQFVRNGYEFLGWSTNQNDTVATHQPGDTYNVEANTTFFAVWAVRTDLSYTVKYMTAGENSTQIQEPETVSDQRYGNTVTADSKKKEIPGYTYAGADKDQITIGTDEGITLYYTPNNYEVKFDANGGTGTMANMQFVYGKNQNLTANTFQKENHTFQGWSKVQNDSVVYQDNASVSNLTTTNGAVVTLYAVWKENAPPAPDAPGKPNAATLNSLIKVSIDCTDRNRHTSDPYTFANLIADSYTVSTPTGDLTNGYTATVTIDPAKYLAAYNKINAGHVLSTTGTAKTINLKATYDSNTWKWALATAGTGTVTFNVEHGYTVTYEWAGEAPYGVEPPVDSKIYTDGDTAYVAAAPKNETWSCKGGEWKWDRLNGRWYWFGCSHRHHHHTYWYADKVDGQIGYWVFTGWTRQVWVNGNRWQHGYWKTETLKPGQKITVNDNVVIYGNWEFKAAAGTVVLSKTVKGLETDADFTFEIYDANNTKKPYKVVKLEDGDRTYVSLPNGTYYITEVDAKVDGYQLDVTVAGDIDADGEKFTIKGDAKIIKYTNTYKVGGPALNTEDHIAYITGYADGTVKPDANITREEAAMIFYRLLTAESRERYATNSNSFTDVKATRWSNTAISTLANAGVLNGYPDGSFKPTANITRGEMANIVSKFYELRGGRTTFTDTATHWAAAAIRSAAAYGWINGYKDGSFKPNQFITRAETVSMINRVLERNPDTVGDLLDGMKTFTDNMKTTKWYYFAIQEAANGHSYTRDPYGNESWTKLN